MTIVTSIHHSAIFLTISIIQSTTSPSNPTRKIYLTHTEDMQWKICSYALVFSGSTIGKNAVKVTALLRDNMHGLENRINRRNISATVLCILAALCE